MFQVVAQAWSSPLLRRAIAMLCVFALLTIAIGHSCEHLGAGTAQASQSLPVDHTNDDTGTTDNAVVVDHCPVCSAAWIPVTVAGMATIVPAGALPTQHRLKEWTLPAIPARAGQGCTARSSPRAGCVGHGLEAR